MGKIAVSVEKSNIIRQLMICGKDYGPVSLENPFKEEFAAGQDYWVELVNTNTGIMDFSKSVRVNNRETVTILFDPGNEQTPKPEVVVNKPQAEKKEPENPGCEPWIDLLVPGFYQIRTGDPLPGSLFLSGGIVSLGVLGASIAGMSVSAYHYREDQTYSEKLTALQNYNTFRIAAISGGVFWAVFAGSSFAHAVLGNNKTLKLTWDDHSFSAMLAQEF